MLIALEEEAAIEEAILHSNSRELAWLKVLSSDVQQQDELEDVELSVVNRYDYQRHLRGTDLCFITHHMFSHSIHENTNTRPQMFMGLLLPVLQRHRHSFKLEFIPPGCTG